jgi:hypothetical protein
MVASLIVAELTKLNMQYPPEMVGLDNYRKQLEME